MVNNKANLFDDSAFRRPVQLPLELEPASPAPELDYDPVYVAEIMRYYHSRNTVPNLLPENYKAYLLAVGLAEYLPGAYEEYVVFSAAGGEIARQANRFSHSKTRGGRPKKTA